MVLLFSGAVPSKGGLTVPQNLLRAFFLQIEPGLPDSLGLERTKNTAPAETVGSTIEGGAEGKKEILVQAFWKGWG
jgi:hypothetical protein